MAYYDRYRGSRRTRRNRIKIILLILLLLVVVLKAKLKVRTNARNRTKKTFIVLKKPLLPFLFIIFTAQSCCQSTCMACMLILTVCVLFI